MSRPRVYPNGRKMVTITVDPIIHERAVSLNLNISRICDMALAHAINKPTPDVIHPEKKQTPAEMIKEVLPIKAEDAVAFLLEKTGLGKEKVKRILREGNGILWKQGPGPDYFLVPLDR